MISPAHTIVFGSPTPESGTTTLAMHVAVGLVRLGYRVGTIDLDARQRSLTRYITNRIGLPSPLHLAIEKTRPSLLIAQDKEHREFFLAARDELLPSFDFIVIDTPGPLHFVSRLSFSYSDTLITPLTDTGTDFKIFSRMIADQKKIRHARDGGEVDWIGLPSHLSATSLEAGLGFRPSPGLTDRDIFQDLAAQGLTLLDVRENPDTEMTLATLSARQEVRQVLRALKPETLKGYPQLRTKV